MTDPRWTPETEKIVAAHFHHFMCTEMCGRGEPTDEPCESGGYDYYATKVLAALADAGVLRQPATGGVISKEQAEDLNEALTAQGGCALPSLGRVVGQGKITYCIGGGEMVQFEDAEALRAFFQRAIADTMKEQRGE